MPNYSLVTEQIIHAPRRLVFEAWLDPLLIKRWMKPKPWVTVDEVFTEPVLGGRFRILMRGHGFEELQEGSYFSIVRPQKLAFSWSSHAAGHETHVLVTFAEEVDGTTLISLRHEGLANNAARDNHHEGWKRILASLSNLFERAR
jgi:uncharacterized protein YndB with AHSA1/START domain